jgi:hypothetical protein
VKLAPRSGRMKGERSAGVAYRVLAPSSGRMKGMRWCGLPCASSKLWSNEGYEGYALVCKGRLEDAG